MRDINRIDIITKELNDLWKNYPDLRFFQLINMLEHKIKTKLDINDLFYIEDNKILNELMEIKKRK